ncbi:ion transporter [Robertkochia solimangrovi]|uniref:ion transporter n=1 Tax=Robertkochia solimangrovi TaxID=2213046 RepID=UPI00117DACBC|nr:ion transporter [Robertkochia solimangrovi]TRZ45387.1 ion transporter [Robertkochia solimangrovi]
MKETKEHKRDWRYRLHEVIYEADTPAGKTFDIILIIIILASILLVMLESVRTFDAKYHQQLLVAEWIITLLFTVEYIARIICIRRPWRYIFSPYGIIDLLATIPLYLSYIIAGSQMLLALRALRLLRIFRILKLARYLGEASQLKRAIAASRVKIFVFIYTVLILSVIMGTIMYLIEGSEAGFTSIPRSIYWTIVTLTTVGYGDIAPQTDLGQVIAAFVMIIGYGIIAVPTGIVTSEFTKQRRMLDKTHSNTQVCRNCNADVHLEGAKYCHKCGSLLNE